MQPLASIPSPSQGVWHLGPIPLRAYAFMIIIGIIVAVWVGERRWTARGGTSGTVVDIAVWAVPFGLVGGRLYHVITDHQLYFGSGANWNPVGSLEIWNGGLGIWGAIALGGVGAWIGCRRRGINFRAFADALAPGIALAQAFGRWGNYFNQELYGRPLHTFWALHIDQAHRPKLPNTDQLDPKYADVATYHPTFLYESIWCVGVAILVVWAGKRYKLNWGRSFALYVAAYTVGRGWIEALRIDNAHHFLGLRLNDYTSIILFLGAIAYMYIYRDKGSVEEVLEPAPAESASSEAAAEDTSTADEAAGTPEPVHDEAAATTEAPESPVDTRADDGDGTAEVVEGTGDAVAGSEDAGVGGRTPGGEETPAAEAAGDTSTAGGATSSAEGASEGPDAEAGVAAPETAEGTSSDAAVPADEEATGAEGAGDGGPGAATEALAAAPRVDEVSDAPAVPDAGDSAGGNGVAGEAVKVTGKGGGKDEGAS